MYKVMPSNPLTVVAQFPSLWKPVKRCKCTGHHRQEEEVELENKSRAKNELDNVPGRLRFEMTQWAPLLPGALIQATNSKNTAA